MFRKASLFAVFALASCAGATAPVTASGFGDSSLMRMCEARGASYLVSAAARLSGQSWTFIEHNMNTSGLDAASRIAVREGYYNTSPGDTEIEINRRANEVIMRCYRSGGQR